MSRLLGHTRVLTTRRYAHMLDDTLRAGIELVDDGLWTKP
jgi:site-specific recombinase XerD